MEKTIGRYPQYLVARYLAEECGVNEKTFGYHLQAGYIPRPSHAITGDNRRYYDDDDVKMLRAYFSNRQLWQHHGKT